MSREVILIRHAEVEPEWKKICYGAMDVPLSEQGLVASQLCAERLDPSVEPTLVFHSGLARTEILARFIADRFSGATLAADERLRERNYGQWQGQSWEEAYASDPKHFHDLVDQPDTYRPPGGETTTEMQQRMVQWYAGITAKSSGGQIIAISHSGPIAALAGHLVGAPANQWEPWMLNYLESIHITSDINGGGGGNILRGGPGNDMLLGGSARDILIGSMQRRQSFPARC